MSRGGTVKITLVEKSVTLHGLQAACTHIRGKQYHTYNTRELKFTFYGAFIRVRKYIAASADDIPLVQCKNIGE